MTIPPGGRSRRNWLSRARGDASHATRRWPGWSPPRPLCRCWPWWTAPWTRRSRRHARDGLARLAVAPAHLAAAPALRLRADADRVAAGPAAAHRPRRPEPAAPPAPKLAAAPVPEPILGRRRRRHAHIGRSQRPLLGRSGRLGQPAARPEASSWRRGGCPGRRAVEPGRARRDTTVVRTPPARASPETPPGRVRSGREHPAFPVSAPALLLRHPSRRRCQRA